MKIMADRDKVIESINGCINIGDYCNDCAYDGCIFTHGSCQRDLLADALKLLKEQEKKPIILHKKHIITWNRNDEFSMRKLYEAICEKLLDEGELFVTRTDNHEKVDFVFYVAEGGKVG